MPDIPPREGVHVSAPAALARGSLIALTVLLIGSDLILIACDILRRNALLGDPRFSLTREGGFSEQWQYVKAASTALFLFATAVRRRSALRLWCGSVFAFVLADDAGQLHERVGQHVGRELALPAIGALGPGHLGEVLFFAAVGLVAGSVCLALLRRARADERAFARAAVLGLAVLAFFGVFVDAVHSLLRLTRWDALLAVFEDGGEMVALSGFLLYLCAEPRARRPGLA